ncbi:MAG: beta-ketoacyl-[acyl-carrier-protein] synthase family protein [Frankia sp.]
MSRPRVAVTGIGMKTPAGNRVDEAFATLLTGRSTAATVPALVDGEAPVTFGCVVPPFDPTDYLPRRELQKMDRAAQLAMAAAAEALADAGDLGSVARDRVGVAVGTGMAGLMAAADAAVDRRDGKALPAFLVPRIMANSPAARIAIHFQAQGPCLTYPTACASGSTAIGEATEKIRSGQVDMAVAGGADAPVDAGIVSSFHRLRALSTRNDAPRAASRPFDDDRDGFVMAEGATFLVLERWELAEARGARIYGEVAGYGSNCDAFHIVAPAPDGVLAARCMAAAIRDAGLAPEQIGHINAHGTSTVLNDRAEAIAVERCFGPKPPPITASKSVVGHMIGGAGAFEAAVGLLSARRGLVPPVANFAGGPDAELVDVVADVPRSIAVGPVLSNSFGFGGHNCCLVLVPAVPADPADPGSPR